MQLLHEIHVTYPSLIFFYFILLLLFFDRETCENSLDPYQMPQTILLHQGLRCFQHTQQCFEKSIDTGMPLLRK